MRRKEREREKARERERERTRERFPIRDRGLALPLPPRLHVLLFRQSSMQRKYGIRSMDARMELCNSNPYQSQRVFHRQQHLRNQRRVPLLLGPSSQENLVISFLPNSSHGREPCYQFSSTVPILKSWAAASMSPFDRQLEASPRTI